MTLRSFLFGAIMYLSWFLFFVAGALFSKIFSAILDLGVIIQFARSISDRILVSLIMLTQELEYLRQLKIDVMKEKGFTEAQIEFQNLLFDKWFTNWKEAVIINFVSSYPQPLKKDLQFHDWATATKYVEKIVKEKRI
jgi:hypothetical protein